MNVNPLSQPASPQAAAAVSTAPASAATSTNEASKTSAASAAAPQASNWLRVSIGIRVALLKENAGLHG